MIPIETIDRLESLVMYLAPLAGGAIASFIGYKANDPTRAMLRTVLLTIFFSSSIALAVGTFIDNSLVNQQWQRWDSLWLPALQIPIGAVVGILFGAIVVSLVNKRIAKQRGVLSNGRNS